jgi:hypothetical protein
LQAIVELRSAAMGGIHRQSSGGDANCLIMLANQARWKRWS